jgi:hypothetical protein
MQNREETPIHTQTTKEFFNLNVCHHSDICVTVQTNVFVCVCVCIQKCLVIDTIFCQLDLERDNSNHWHYIKRPKNHFQIALHSQLLNKLVLSWVLILAAHLFVMQ